MEQYISWKKSYIISVVIHIVLAVVLGIALVSVVEHKQTENAFEIDMSISDDLKASAGGGGGGGGGSFPQPLSQEVVQAKVQAAQQSLSSPVPVDDAVNVPTSTNAATGASDGTSTNQGTGGGSGGEPVWQEHADQPLTGLSAGIRPGWQSAPVRTVPLSASFSSCRRRYLAWSCSRLSLRSKLMGMHSTGQIWAHWGSSKWPTHSVQRLGSMM